MRAQQPLQRLYLVNIRIEPHATFIAPAVLTGCP
jgi:hypothetical protein